MFDLPDVADRSSSVQTIVQDSQIVMVKVRRMILPMGPG